MKRKKGVIKTLFISYNATQEREKHIVFDARNQTAKTN